MKSRVAKTLSAPAILTLGAITSAHASAAAAGGQAVTTINNIGSIGTALINASAIFATLAGFVVLAVILFQKFKSEREVENFGTKMLVGAGLTLLGGGYLTNVMITDSGMTAANPKSTTFSAS
ncbi:hypothetical protein V6259_12475 [Marinomonas sp. TI.3.20]|uniref:hypothetical protein n=1 Tax=Marinomonas sp. TI.3.20 TaxID=3121296 RepID=UPI00311F7D4D